ncbi:hypothetical protein [Beijerinckia sp. L45]|uniref:hypothetical protein n=1 Tax=Beijerinckia sp. L45 TaxID=1641855 RepID=UPI00131CF91D|nr:hypothetical protein [Beijerinckia sp. L45]
MSDSENHPDAFITEAQEDRLNVILEFAVYYWSFEHKLDAQTVKSLIIEIAQLLNQELFSAPSRSDADIAKAALKKVAVKLKLPSPPVASP